jgi:hypothetical protein
MSPKDKHFPEGLRLELRTKLYNSCSVEDGECILEEEMVRAKARGKRQTNSLKEQESNHGIWSFKAHVGKVETAQSGPEAGLVMLEKTTKNRVPGLTPSWAGCWVDSCHVVDTTAWSSCELEDKWYPGKQLPFYGTHHSSECAKQW